jgi:arylsulfatase A-like enzyme
LGATLWAAQPVSAALPDLVLVTIDTVRADALAPWGGPAGMAPTIEGLARSGTVFDRAISPAPLTLPAHASLLTGLDPPAHGLRDNGVGALPAEVETLAQLFERAGYTTLAAVGSRVLDRRFGLDRGFAYYDDGAPAERLGEFGYPERDAIATTNAALELLRQADPTRPLFLWVHYYDPHAPYQPADGSGTADPRANYSREIATVDREFGRLVQALPNRPRVVAVVADHGEAFGEHGETGHGLLLHESVLRVPLVLAGAGVPVGKRVGGTVGSVRLAATLRDLAGLRGLAAAAPPLSFTTPGDEPILSETWLPWTAWGWSPLQTVTAGMWRLRVGPKPQLFDLGADPAEAVDRRQAEPRRLRELETARRRLDAPEQRREPEPGGDAETAAALRSLGYVGAGSGRRPRAGDVAALARSGLRDPAEGPALLAEHERAKQLLAEGQAAAALTVLDRLVDGSPSSVPFRSTRSGAREAVGDTTGALADLEAAIRLAPELDFLALSRADQLARLGRRADADAEWTRALALNPRAASAWLGLAESAALAGNTPRERAVLEQGVAAQTSSASLHLRLAQLDLAAGALDSAARHAATARQLAPGWRLVRDLEAAIAKRRR